MAVPSSIPDAPAGPPRRAMLVLFLTVFLDLLGFGIVIPILQLYALTLHATDVETGVLLAIYSMMQLLFAPVWGRLSDRVGRRPVLLLSIFGSCASQLGYALSPSFGFLVLSRALAGVCGANIPAAQAYVADITDERSRAGALGVLGAAFGLGFVIGPVVGGELGHVSARLPFFAASALAALNFVLAFLLLREPRSASQRAHAAVLSRAALRRVLGQPRLRRLLVLFLLVTFGFSNMEGIFALFCARRFGYDQQQVGRLFTLVGVVMVVIQGGVVRKLAPRWGERRLVFLGIGLMGLGLCVMAAAHAVPPLLCGLVLLAAGSGLHSPSLSSLISRTAGAQQGSVLGVSQSLGALGRILGPLSATSVFRLGTSVPYLIAAGCMGAGLLLFGSRRGGRGPEEV